MTNLKDLTVNGDANFNGKFKANMIEYIENTAYSDIDINTSDADLNYYQNNSYIL